LLVKSTVGHIFLERGLLTQEQIDVLLRYQRESGVRFASAAVELGYLSETSALEVLAGQLCVPGVALGQINLDTLDFSVIGVDACIEYRVLPYKVYRKTCVVIMADPLNGLTRTQLKAFTHRQITATVALEGSLNTVLRKITRRHERLRTFRAQDSHEVLPGQSSQAELVREDAISDAVVARRARARQALRDGIILMRDGEWAAALVPMQESVQLDPFDARTHRYLAQIYAVQAAWQDAAESYRRALSLDAHHFDSWCGLASILEQLGDMSTAITAWTSAIENASHGRDRHRIENHVHALKHAGDSPI